MMTRGNKRTARAKSTAWTPSFEPSDSAAVKRRKDQTYTCSGLPTHSANTQTRSDQAHLSTSTTGKLLALVLGVAATGFGCATGTAEGDAHAIPGAPSSEPSSALDDNSGTALGDDSDATDDEAAADDDVATGAGDDAAAEGTGDEDADSDAPGGDVDEPTVPDQPVQQASTLRVDGRYVVDTCGNRLVMRGVEQVFGLGIDVGGSFATLVDEIAKSGANAVRVLPNLEQLSVADVDAILTRIVSHRMVIFLSPGDRSWFARDDVQEMLARHQQWLIVDAFQEPNYDDRTRWQADAIAAIQTVRQEGYTVPITVLANQYGRDLPSLLMHGADVVAADDLGNTILGWQAYWGVGGWYQGEYGLTLGEAVQTAAEQAFPIQAGIDGFADPGEAMDYVGTMAESQRSALGWLWWDWYNPFGPSNNLTNDGTASNLTTLGANVVSGDENGLASAQKACSPGGG
jgi:mannan endo-1,4-beta-mannosidase